MKSWHNLKCKTFKKLLSSEGILVKHKSNQEGEQAFSRVQIPTGSGNCAIDRNTFFFMKHAIEIRVNYFFTFKKKNHFKKKKII